MKSFRNILQIEKVRGPVNYYEGILFSAFHGKLIEIIIVVLKFDEEIFSRP